MPRTDPTELLAPGTLVAGRFDVVAVAARGGMGAVFRAMDRLSGHPVALKVLHHPDAEVEARFRREAAVLAAVDHPGVVRYVSHGTLPDFRPWLAMEWVDGEELRGRILGRGLDVAETLAMARAVAATLAAVHARHIVHRDVKPSNILLAGGDAANPRLLDFGIARATATQQQDDPPTQAGVVLGTLGYLAPEQARGEPDVTSAADVFALGVVLYRCLSGRAPFEAPNPSAALTRILFEHPPRLRALRPELPAELDDLVFQMLAKRADERPRDGAAVVAALTRIRAVGAAPGPSAVAGPSLTTGERRLVGVVIARAPAGAGVSPLGPEEIERITGFGGRIEQLADGSLAIVLATRGTAGDLAAQAARCALVVRRDWDGAMALVTGRGDAAGETPFGDVIDRAWGLVTGAGARGVVVDDTTAGLLGGRFDVVRTGGQSVLRRELTGSAARTLLGVATPCVGRDRELGVLRGLYDAAVATPQSQAVLVVAPSGQGKSRLRQEFVTRLAGVLPAPQLWTASGDPLHAGSPFVLVAGLARSALRLDTPSVPALLAALATRLTPAQVRDHAPFLGELVDLPFDAETDARLRAARADPMLMGDRMGLAWDTLLGAALDQGPVVLVLDDLQWGDLPTVRWLDRALRNFDERPLLVLALARPEVQDVFPALWSGRRLEEWRLGGLARRAAEKLVRAVLGDKIDAAGVAAILDRADGNAFYLEELIRARAAGRSAFPETVLAMAQSRVESLEPEARRLLRAASVFGGSAWRGGIEALVGHELGTGAVDNWLEVLVARELLVARPISSFPGELEVGFRHALVREAAYAMLTEEDRALGHRLAGNWLLQAGETDPLVLGEHFERGGRLGAASRQFEAAAAAALEGDDLGAVLTHAGRALQCGARGERAGTLHLLRAEALRWRGDLQLAEVASAEAWALLPRGGAASFRAAGERAEVLGALARFDEVGVLAHEVRDTPPGEGADGARIVAIARIALALLFAGRYTATDALLRLASRADAILAADPVARGFTYRALSNHATFQGDVVAALLADERTVEAFDAAGDRRNRVRAVNSLGFANLELGRYAMAEEQFADALAEADRLGLGATSALCRQNLGLAVGLQGGLVEGIALEEESFRELDAIGHTRLAAASLAYLAQLQLLAGEPGAALATAREAERRLAVVSEPGSAYCLTVQARANLALGRAADALRASSAAYEVLLRLGAVDEGEAGVRLAHALALAACGRYAEADEVTEAARARLRERAARIGDPELRRHFLEDIREHRETLGGG